MPRPSSRVQRTAGSGEKQQFKFSASAESRLASYLQEKQVRKLEDRIGRLLGRAFEKPATYGEKVCTLEVGFDVLNSAYEFVRDLDEDIATGIAMQLPGTDTYDGAFDAMGFLPDLVDSLNQVRKATRRALTVAEKEDFLKFSKSFLGRLTSHVVNVCHDAGIKVTTYDDSPAVQVLDTCLVELGRPKKTPEHYIRKYLKHQKEIAKRIAKNSENPGT